MSAGLVSVLQEAEGHGAVGETEGHGSLGEMIMDHVVDHDYVELPFGRHLQLPHWDPIQLGPLAIDLSPTKYTVFLALSAALVALLLIWSGRQTRLRGPGHAPRGLANMMEAFVLYLRDEVVLANIGKGGERYVPFVVTLFFFIAMANLLGLLPWGASPTANLSVTLALAAMSFVVIEIAGFKALGPRGYARTVLYWPEGMPIGMKIPLFLIMTPIELLGKITKPFALMIRLFANMAAGKFIILSLVGLIFLAAPIAGFVLPIASVVLMAVAITVLKVFVSLLQAYIFAMLTSVFIGLIRHAH